MRAAGKLLPPIPFRAQTHAPQSLLDSTISNVLCLPRPDATLLHIPDVPIHTLGKHTSTPPHIVALPGSFNPLHPGHAAALHACVAACDPQRHAQPLYELSVFNVDKPPVPLSQLQDRLAHFSRQNTCVLLTNTPRFVDKARAYPGMSYVVGVDTLLRLVDPLYTGGSVDLMTHALEGIAREGSVFFVLPRAFAAAKIPAKFGLQMQDNELLTYGMVRACCVVLFCLHCWWWFRCFVIDVSRSNHSYLSLFAPFSKR